MTAKSFPRALLSISSRATDAVPANLFPLASRTTSFALAIFRTACERWPGRPTTLRQGARVIEDSRRLPKATNLIASGDWTAVVAGEACQSFWLTKRRKTPTPINAAIRVPTTNETTQFRPSIGFDRAPCCAAPMPIQKRSLSIERSLAHQGRMSSQQTLLPSRNSA